MIPPVSIFWFDQYGGLSWVLACKTWLQLYQARNLADQTVHTDKLYSVEYNSGALLGKNPEYKGEWVQELLDMKFKANDPVQLIPHSSNYMRTLALRVLRSQHGRS